MRKWAGMKPEEVALENATALSCLLSCLSSSLVALAAFYLSNRGGRIELAHRCK